MGRFDKLPGIDESQTTRRNAAVGAVYALAGCVTVSAITGDTEDSEAEGQNNDEPEQQQVDEEEDGPQIAFEDDWFGPVTEEHNPETFDPEEDLDTVLAWIDDAVEFLEFVFLEMDMNSVDAWIDAGERADELDDRFVAEDEIDLMFSRIVDDGNIADGIPAWDYELASVINGEDGGLYGAVLDVRTAAISVENEGEATESFIISAAESIALALDALDEYDEYDYDAPEEVEEFQ